MPTFALKKMELPITASVEVCWLEIDGSAPFQDFTASMEKSGKRSDLVKLSVLFEEIAHGRQLPRNAIKELKGVPAEDDWREYELRKNQLRVYFFLIPPDNNVVVMGEFKKKDKEQRKNITKFREIKAAFKAAYLRGELEEE